MHTKKQNINLTIVIPNFNHSKFIARAIFSSVPLLKCGAELIVIDDASTDESLSIIYKCNKKVHFKLIKNKINQGVAKSCQQAVAFSKKKYLTFLAADDYFSPIAPRLINEMLKRNPECKLFLWNSLQKFELNTSLKDKLIYSSRHNALFDRYNSPKYFCKKNLGIPFVGTGLFEKTVFLKAGGFDYEFKSFADYFLSLRIISQHGFYLNSKPLSVFRQTSSNLKNKQDLLSNQNIVFRYFLKTLKKEKSSCFKEFFIQSGAILIFEELLFRHYSLKVKGLKKFLTSRVKKILFLKRVRKVIRNPIPSYIKKMFRNAFPDLPVGPIFH